VTRGDIVVVATRGAYTSKPRPALVVQSNLYNSTHASITICPVTSELADAPLFRISLPPGARTGLKAASQVMIDKIVSVPRESVGRTVGRCLPQELDAVDEALRTWLAL
jgi:mRNA interferase MazF